MHASLIPLDGGQAIELVKDITVIGRKAFCDVQLDDPSVSKVHLLIAKTDGLLLFRDMGSTNGTRVNGQRVIRGMLLPNDKLQIAALKYQVHLRPNDSGVGTKGEKDPSAHADDAMVRVYKAQDLAQEPGTSREADMAPETDQDSDVEKYVEPPGSATPPQDVNASKQFAD